MYYKTGTWVYRPNRTQLSLKFAKEVDGDFGDPEFHEGILSREVLQGSFEGTWFDCIELN